MGSRTSRTEFPEGPVTVSRTNEVTDSEVVVTYELEHGVGGYAVVEVAERLPETRVANSEFHSEKEPRQYDLMDDRLTFEAVVPPDETETVILSIEYEDEATFPVGEPAVDLMAVQESRDGDESDARSDGSSGHVEREGVSDLEIFPREIKGASPEEVEAAVTQQLGDLKDDGAPPAEIERSREALEEHGSSPENLKAVIARRWSDLGDESTPSRSGGDGSVILDRPESTSSSDEGSDVGARAIDGDDSSTEPSDPVDDAGTDEFTYVGSTESEADETGNAERRMESFDEGSRSVDDPSTSGTAIDGTGSVARGGDSLVSTLLEEIRAGRVDDEELEAFRSELGFGRSEQLRIRRIQSRMEDFELYVDALEELIDVHGTEPVDIVESRFESVRSEIVELEREIERLSEEVAEANERARSVEESTDRDIAAVRSSVETEITDLRTQIEGLVALCRPLVAAVEAADLDD